MQRVAFSSIAVIGVCVCVLMFAMVDHKKTDKFANFFAILKALKKPLNEVFSDVVRSSLMSWTFVTVKDSN